MSIQMTDRDLSMLARMNATTSTGPARVAFRLGDQDVDHELRDATERFLMDVAKITSHCDWSESKYRSDSFRTAGIQKAIREEVAELMTSREPRD